MNINFLGTNTFFFFGGFFDSAGTLDSTAVTSASSTEVVFFNSDTGMTTTLAGTGFVIDDGMPVAGTVTGIEYEQSGITQGAISGIAWNAGDLTLSLDAIGSSDNYSQLAALINASATITIDASTAGAGLNIFALFSGAYAHLTTPLDIVGSEFYDFLIGTAGADTINPGSNYFGNDDIKGTLGNDTIDFADVTAESSAWLDYEDFVDGAITFNIDSVANTGTIVGVGFTDVILDVTNFTWDGGLTLEASENNDTFNVTVRDGSWMSMIGNEGQDTYNINMIGNGRIRFDQGATAAPTQSVVVNLATGVVGNDGFGNTETINWLGGSGQLEIVAGAAADNLTGSARDESFVTGQGNDTVDGGGGFDRLRYDRSGVETVNVDLSVGSASGVWFGSTFTDTISNIESIRGSQEGDDTLRGAGANESLDGRGGNDSLEGRAGEDTIYGGAGNDTARGDDGNDFVYGGEGDDNLFGNQGDDHIEGGDGDDRLSGSTGNDSMRGDGGNDTIYGGSGNDTLRGGDGANELYSGDGNDKVYGGSGNETVSGGSGNDLVVGDGGNDLVEGGFGEDTLYGNAGNDTLNGEAGNDWASGGDGADLLLGRDGNDTMRGGNDDDRFFGGAGDDVIAGNFGNDTLEGGSGDDRLFGGNNDDVIVGGAGSDVMNGGSGADVFVFENISDSSHGAVRDRIADFTHNVDQIDLSDIMLGLTFVASYTGTAGEVRYNGGIGRLYIDIDGDSASDFSVDITGAPTLDAGDLIF